MDNSKHPLLQKKNVQERTPDSDKGSTILLRAANFTPRPVTVQ